MYANDKSTDLKERSRGTGSSSSVIQQKVVQNMNFSYFTQKKATRERKTKKFIRGLLIIRSLVRFCAYIVRKVVIRHVSHPKILVGSDGHKIRNFFLGLI